MHFPTLPNRKLFRAVQICVFVLNRHSPSMSHSATEQRRGAGDGLSSAGWISRIFPAFTLSLLLSLFAPTPILHAVTGETVTLRPYQRAIRLTGFTRAKQKITISSEVAGRCMAVHVDRGDTIPPSGKLASIDDTFIAIDLEANEVARKKIQRKLTYEQKTLQRYTTLHGQKSVPQATLDEVSLNADLHRFSLMDLENEQRRLKERRRRFEITAPPGWQVLERLVEPGEYVQPGRAIAHIGDYRELLIPLALSFNELQSLRSMDQITVILPDIDLRVTAGIYRTSPGFDPKTRKIPVDLIVTARQQHTDISLRGGMRARIMLTSQEQSNAFVIPVSAVISRYDAHWVVKTNRERVKVVFIGLTEDKRSAIISTDALSVNDQVIDNPELNF